MPRAFRVLIAATAAIALLMVATSSAAAAEITSSGPLERIIITPQLNCQVKHESDGVFSFYPSGSTTGDCGTFAATGGTLFGPSACSACGSATPRTGYTPVSQVGPTGTGTAADPYRIVTVVTLGSSGLQIEETDTYVTGDEAYRSDVRIINNATSARTGIVWRAGDCYLQSSDNGFGRADGEAISCVGDDTSQAGNQPGTRIEQFLPVTAGSSYYQDNYDSVWARIGAQGAFQDICSGCPTTFTDNGAGLSWNFNVAAGSSQTYSSFITFSPLGRQPLTTTKTADSSTSEAGGTNGYTITIENPNAQDAVLSEITDTLPAGFSYRPGTTQEPGGGTDDPAIAGQELTWSGPYTVPAGGSVSLSFDVNVSSTPGTYFNEAGGDSADFTVVPTGPTAPITVTEEPDGVEGWMSGEGRLSQGGNHLDYAFIIDCDPARAPTFKGKRGSQNLNVTDITAVECTDDPSQEPAMAGAQFDTMEGTGTGKLGSTNVIVEFKFVDGGLDNTDDSAAITIKRASDSVVLFTASAEPIPPYGGGTRPGRNTANPPRAATL